MPFPRTWSEELIAEWLQLDGFLTQTNLPVRTSKEGGRFEADVVGAKVEKGILRIRHVETGALAGGKKSAESVQKKFGPEIAKCVSKYFQSALSLVNPETNYERIYVATFWSQPVIQMLAAAGVKTIPLPDFIRDCVLPTARKWKEDPPHQPQAKGPRVALPESLWLLQLLDCLKAQGMLATTTDTQQ